MWVEVDEEDGEQKWSVCEEYGHTYDEGGKCQNCPERLPDDPEK